MNTWKDKLIEQFIPDLDPRVWAVEDPDGIVRNEKVLAALSDKGFDVVFFDDPVAFRYEYESRIRRSWERGNRHPLVVVYEPGAILPSDLLQRAHSKSFGLHALFPKLDAGVMRCLSPDWWSTLAGQAIRQPGKTFTAGETEELALRVCFKLVPDLIDTVDELLRKIIELHRLGIRLPERLCRRLERDWLAMGIFQEWPVFDLLADPDTLWRFLQERWLLYLHGQGAIDGDEPVLHQPGPRHIPFESPALQVYWDNLFDEGLLQPVDCGAQAPDPSVWWRIGIVTGKESESFNSGRLDKLARAIPKADSGYREWIRFGLKYSRVVADLFGDDNKEAIQAFWDKVWPSVDEQFAGWIQDGYLGLYNLPPTLPSMVHHIPRQLLRWHNEGEKVALLVLDGLSCAGWFGLKSTVFDADAPDLLIEESASFAWLPSLTPVSRQALFAGLPPRLFSDSIDRTDKDAARWAEFWKSSASLFSRNIYHQLLEGNPDDLSALPDFNADPISVYGATVSMPDELMHGQQLGWRGLYELLTVWAKGGFLRQYISRLLDAGFRVCITSDHGNLEALGIGKIQDGALAERRGQRIRLYTDAGLRNNAAASVGNNGLGWDSSLLPDGSYPLYATGRSAFVAQGDTIVSHGGASLDELLVPWISIKRKI